MRWRWLLLSLFSFSVGVAVSACACADAPAPTKRPSSGEWVSIPAGTFLMGSPDGVGGANEHPQHRVTLSAFSIHRTEVTVASYEACQRAGSCTAPDRSEPCNSGVAGRSEHPINCVDWNQASAFCGFVNGRLPTEAEWEYAARGTDGRTYPWGNEEPNDRRLRWSGVCGTVGCIGSTSTVGNYPSGASPFGLQDMAGNVWEWTADWVGPYGSDANNPRGPSTGEYRTSRGGGWHDDQSAWVRAAVRNWGGPASRYDFFLGFRCARGA